MRQYADLILALISLVWGAMFVIAKVALDDISSTYYLALRFTLAALVLGLLFHRRLPKIQWTGVALGVVLMAGYILQTLGLRTTSPAKSAFLTGGYIVLVPFFAWLVYRQSTRVAEVLGVLTATLGMALLSIHGESLSIAPGDWLTLACAAVFAIHIVLLGHFSPRIPLEALTFFQIAAAALTAWLALPFLETPTLRWRPAVLIAIVIGGLVATALAFLVQTWAQQHIPPTRAALIFALEPVFAWLLAWYWNGELLTGRSATGAALILAGVLLVEMKPKHTPAHP